MSFATFCEILNRAVVTLHGWLKSAAFRDGPQVLSCACDVEVPQKAPRSVAVHFQDSMRDVGRYLEQRDSWSATLRGALSRLCAKGLALSVFLA